MPPALTSHKSSALNGSVSVPGDKSISHRALMFGALATGETVIEGLLEAEDVLATADVMGRLGAEIERRDDAWHVLGRGVGGLSGQDIELDFGNSGTSARLVMGILAGSDISARLTGDASLTKRPMGRVVRPLMDMGLQVENDDGSGNYFLPLQLRGIAELLPMEYKLPVASAQVKSAILLAGLHSAGRTTVIEPMPTRDHTERMLAHFGVALEIGDGPEGRRISLEGRQELSGQAVIVPGDPSSASFPIAAALMVPGSSITVNNVLCNPLRNGLFETLKEMGADIRFENERQSSGERVADITANYGELRGVEVPAQRAASMIDEYPVLSVIAASAKGTTVMRGLSELRVKESDRLASTLAGLEANGIDAHIDGDDLIVQGMEHVPGGGMVASQMDHRIAMSFLVLGLASDKAITIDDKRMIATSFPEFEELMVNIGARIEGKDGAT